jgi:hypothetical protein
METLANALPKEQERVRELIPIYESVGVAGAFAVAMMKSSLRAAEIAAASGDVVAMVRALEDLRGYDG